MIEWVQLQYTMNKFSSRNLNEEIGEKVR